MGCWATGTWPPQGQPPTGRPSWGAFREWEGGAKGRCSPRFLQGGLADLGQGVATTLCPLPGCYTPKSHFSTCSWELPMTAGLTAAGGARAKRVPVQLGQWREGHQSGHVPARTAGLMAIPLTSRRKATKRTGGTKDRAVSPGHTHGSSARAQGPGRVLLQTKPERQMHEVGHARSGPLECGARGTRLDWGSPLSTPIRREPESLRIRQAPASLPLCHSCHKSPETWDIHTQHTTPVGCVSGQ